MDVAAPLLKNTNKIAILRANALGDFIVTLPALHAIRAAYPNAELVLLGKPWHRQFLQGGRSPIDRVIVVPVMQGIRSEGSQQENKEEVNEFVQQIQKERFDIVLNMQGSGVSANPFIKQFGAVITAGLVCEKSEKLDLCFDYYYYQSEVIRYLEVAKLIGASAISLEPELTVLPQDELEVKDFILSFNAKPCIVLHPIALDIRRMWPIENYAGLADELRSQNFEVVFTGSAADRSMIDVVISQMTETAINACGDFSLGGLTAVLSKAALMIAADTGPLHLARAVNTPTIGFYWAPNLINWGPVTRGIHRPLISWNMACPICGAVPNDPYPFEPQNEGCTHEISFVSNITIEQVLEHIQPSLQQIKSVRDKDISKLTGQW